MLPDYGLVKSVSNPDVLREARETWAQAGRAQDKLFTIYRYYFTDYPDWNHTYTGDELKAYWRGIFNRFINRTFLETQVAQLSAVESLNEHTDSRMVTDKALLLPHLRAEQYAVEVWQTEYRGKVVHAQDGSSGLIPDYVRLCIVNGPVGNDIPAEFMKLAIDSDNWLGYHNYQNVIGGKPTPNEFQFYSGRWVGNEQAAGLRPTWAFTEGGPFIDTAKGWRHPECLNGDLAGLIACQRLVTQATSKTDAAAQGRLIGPTALFTASNSGWPWYQYKASDFLAVNQMFGQEWRVAAPGSVPMTNPLITQHAQAIIYHNENVWWLRQPPIFKTSTPNKVITFRHADGTPIIPNPRPAPITYQLDVYAVNDMLALLQVTNFTDAREQWWVLAADVSPA